MNEARCASGVIPALGGQSILLIVAIQTALISGTGFTSDGVCANEHIVVKVNNGKSNNRMA
jgi:hypothetical protein